MPNDARIEELAKETTEKLFDHMTTQAQLNVISEALRTAIREAREEQIRKDAAIVQLVYDKFKSGNEIAIDRITIKRDELPFTLGPDGSIVPQPPGKE